MSECRCARNYEVSATPLARGRPSGALISLGKPPQQAAGNVSAFGDVALVAAGVEVVRIGLPILAQNQRHRLQGAVVRAIFLRAPALGLQQDRAKLERSIVGDAKLPVHRQPLHRVLQVAVHDAEQVGDLLPKSLVRPHLSGLGPVTQAHAGLP